MRAPASTWVTLVLLLIAARHSLSQETIAACESPAYCVCGNASVIARAYPSTYAAPGFSVVCTVSTSVAPPAFLFPPGIVNLALANFPVLPNIGEQPGLLNLHIRAFFGTWSLSTWSATTRAAIVNITLYSPRALEARPLQGLTSLQRIEILGSFPSALPTDMLSGLSSLKSIVFATPTIQSFPATLFAGLSTLTSVTFSLANPPWPSLQPLTNLLEFDALVTTLSYVPADMFSANTQLIKLSLGSNQITSIAPRAFANNVQLRVLDLSNNLLSGLPPQLLQPLLNLHTLLLQNNRISNIPVGLFAGAFLNTSAYVRFDEWYTLNVTASLDYYPVVDLAANMLSSITPSTFASIPKNVFIRLTDVLPQGGLSTLTLPSCCGLEFLAVSTSQFLYYPGTLLCVSNGVTIAIDSFNGTLFCPCIMQQVRLLNFTLQPQFQSGPPLISADIPTCTYLSTFKVVNGSCAQALSCPAGQHLAAQYGQGVNSPGLKCQTQTGTYNLLETLCEECSVAHCLACPGTASNCTLCAPDYWLLDGLCLSVCPAGMRNATAMINGQTASVCQACDQAQCRSCPVHSHICEACVSPAFQLLSGVCIGCSDVHCVNCQKEYSKCDLCAQGFLSFQGVCVTSCPADYAAVGGLCAALSSSSAYSRTGLITGVVLGVALLAALVVYFRVRFLRRQQQVESELRQQLLSSQTEASTLKRVWQIDYEEIRTTGLLGCGAFGEVHAGIWCDMRVAIKQIRAELVELDDQCRAEFEREVQFMQSIRHPNIVLFFGAGTRADGSQFLVTELVQRGSLRGLLKSSLSLSYDQKLRMIRDAARGMAHLHGLRRVHRDLKTDNLLVTSTMRVKVSDFGTACLLDINSSGARRSMRSPAAARSQGPKSSGRSAFASTVSGSSGVSRGATTNVGTPVYMAPEMLASLPYDSSVDVYSFGIVMWEVLTQQDPWEDLPSDNFREVLLETLLAGVRPPVPATTPADFTALLQRVWATDRHARPAFSDIALDPCFATLDSA